MDWLGTRGGEEPQGGRAVCVLTHSRGGQLWAQCFSPTQQRKGKGVSLVGRHTLPTSFKPCLPDNVRWSQRHDSANSKCQRRHSLSNETDTPRPTPWKTRVAGEGGLVSSGGTIKSLQPWKFAISIAILLPYPETWAAWPKETPSVLPGAPKRNSQGPEGPR